MSYRGKRAYQEAPVADTYDAWRFSSLKGQLVDWFEKALIGRALRRLPRGALMLDLPAGTGRITGYLKEQGYAVIGADISHLMLRHARVAWPDIRFLVADAEHLPFPDGAFDAVTSIRLMHHVPASIRVQILSELGRVSRGPIVVTYANTLTLQAQVRRLRSARDTARMPIYPATRADALQEARQASLTRYGDWPMIPLYASTHVFGFRRMR